MARKSTFLRWGWMLPSAALLIGIPIACFLSHPPQAWDPARGPVVPHDSFPADCGLCHITEDWHTIKKDFRFDHAEETGYPLLGAHAAADCLLCHNDRGPVQRFAVRGCRGCHEDPHDGHLGSTCDACHDQRTWRPNEMIAKHASTRFPLIGAHALAACFACHPGATAGNFQRADTHCISCHRDDLARATEPDHATLGWIDCGRCHLPTAFSDVRFAHSVGFPLTGAHRTASCDACHEGNVFTSLPRDCASCHQAEYQATGDPNHVAAGFPTTCETCHSTNPGWRPATVDHGFFALSLGHAGLDCAACHTGGVFQGTPTTCSACHIADYNGTTDPGHGAAGFPTTCESCHSTNPGWRPATVDHGFFALTLGHAGLDCTDCHKGGVFQGTSTTCSACHIADFNATTDPAHAAAGFPTTCDTCHTTQPGWTPATFDHTFPILSGPHAALSCTDCHENPASFAVFTCVSCHDHNRADMDEEHDEVSGYVYASPSCLDCHPQGREDD